MISDNIQCISLLWLLCLVSNASDAQTPDRVLWNQTPIPVHITIGTERILHFPGDIRYWLPDSLSTAVRPLAASNTLYLKALKSFDVTRIRVQQLDNQQVYLLDVRASDLMVDQDPIRVMIQKAQPSTAEFPVNKRENQPILSVIDWRVRLTRFAAQRLYARPRRQLSDSSVRRADLPSGMEVRLTSAAHDLKLTPVASWKGGGYYVTAVVIDNLSQQRLSLDFGQPTAGKQMNVDIRSSIPGQWVTASIHHQTLGAKGSGTSTTAIYLVSNQPFLDSVSQSALQAVGEHYGS